LLCPIAYQQSLSFALQSNGATPFGNEVTRRGQSPLLKGRVTSLQKSTKLIHSLTEAFPCKKLTKLVSKKPTGVCKN